MEIYKYCSACGSENHFGSIDGNERFHCVECSVIHYQNPKPTATLICPKGNSILLGKRAFSPAKGEWGLPGGFMELNETLYQAALRELKEETQLTGSVSKILGTCSHFGSIFGDVLLIGLEVKITNWATMCAGDDVAELKLFNINELPELAFHCHKKIISYYLDSNHNS